MLDHDCNEMPLWLFALHTLFPLWNCNVAPMAFARYVSTRPESLAARERLNKETTLLGVTKR